MNKSFHGVWTNIGSIIVGSIGWAVAGNLVFLFSFYVWLVMNIGIFGFFVWLGPWLITTLAMAILLYIKKPWACVGIALAVCVNAVIWMNFLGFDFELWQILLYAGMPLPAGFLIGFN